MEQTARTATDEVARVAGRPGPPRRVALRLLSCVVIIAGGILWAWPDSRADAQTSQVSAAPASAYSETEFRPWLSDGTETVGPNRGDDLDAATQILTVEREAIQCERPLELTLFVHEADGTPVHNAEILCDWQDQSGSHKLRARTDYLGVAKVRRWIPASEFGRVTRISVHVDTDSWSADRWVWFIPR